MEKSSHVLESFSETHFGRTLLEITRDFYASSPKELPVSKGEVVKYLSRDNEWIRVKTTDGCTGYIPYRCCRPYDAKRIRQKRRQAYTGFQAASLSKENYTNLQSRHVNQKKEASQQLQMFINTAVNQALQKMSVANKVDEHANGGDETISGVINERLSCDNMPFINKCQKSPGGVCGRSCRVCYNQNGVKRSISQGSIKDDTYVIDSNKLELGSATLYEGQLVTESTQEDVTSCINTKKQAASDFIQCKQGSCKKDLKFESWDKTDNWREDRSDSGICVVAADDCSCSRCSSDSDENFANEISLFTRENDPGKEERFLLSPETYKRKCLVKDRKRKKDTSYSSKLTRSLGCHECYFSDGQDTSTTLLVVRNFCEEEEGELSVCRGEVVTIIGSSDSDWIWVRNEKGLEGFIPRAYVIDGSCQECLDFLSEKVHGDDNCTQLGENLNTVLADKIMVPDTTSKTTAKGVRFYVLSDYTGINGNTVNVKVGDVVVANMKDQLVDGWLWIYALEQKISGYLPEEILLEADPVEVTEV